MRLPAAGALLTTGAFAQPAYPDRPIRFVVPVAPGAGTDLVARQVSVALNKLWNASVLVDNKPGAGGVLGTDAVAKAMPDGYTVLFTFSTHYTTPWLEKTPYDAVADFEPVAKLASTTLFMVTAADSPLRSVADVVAASKRAPRSISYASAGQGTPSHMCGALLGSITGIEMIHAPYKNGSQAMIETGSGQVQVAFSGPAALPLVRSGRLRVLAVTADKRSAQLAEVPTMNEAAGIVGYDIASPVWSLAPRGTPAAIVGRLSEAFAAITAAADFKAFCAAQYLEQDYQNAAAMKAAAAGESAKWRRLVELTKT
ncbi:tripartite tricarboxylate transporter substrate binding protein [Variovorax sp. KK3]|uniref:Bug family tripartite tricarboxylate transporter substrate binding protein n=1 Tax=Variovorax sp. KK3 TaxID=1855728 RepID=UPI0015C33979|nr:tripartite tricarboxylate transporter substrate binding protein [Variovorax sp. KK3]